MIYIHRVTAGWKRWLSVLAYGLVTRLMYGADTPVETARRRFEWLATVSRDKMKAKFPKMVFGDHQAGALRIDSLCAVADPRRVVLYLHGGGYIVGSAASYRDRARVLSYRCRAEVFIPDYRLAPENPFPAALEDALAAWDYVTAQRPDAPLAIAGDSAGGGLTLSLIAALRDAGKRLPDGAVLISPWADLAITGESITSNHGKDVWMNRHSLEAWSRYYVGGSDARHPGISPLYADYTGFPPLYLVVGGDEVMLDDSLRVEAKAKAAGVDVEACVGRRMQHDFPITLPWLEESREAWERIVSFLDRAVVSPARSTNNIPQVGQISSTQQ